MSQFPINLMPYTNFHDINLDWVLENMRIILDAYEDYDVRIKAIEAAQEDVPVQIAEMRAEITAEKIKIQKDFDDLVAEFDAKFAAQEASVDAKVNAQNQVIADFKRDVEARISAIYAHLNQQLAEYDTYIKSYIASQLLDVKVINYFTGQKVSVQDMFDYLASFHIEDGLTYSQMAELEKTYAEVIAAAEEADATYSDMVNKAALILA